MPKKKVMVDVVKIGRMGGRARAESLTPKEASDIGKKAANSRWANMSEEDRRKHGAMLAASRKKKQGKKK